MLFVVSVICFSFSVLRLSNAIAHPKLSHLTLGTLSLIKFGGGAEVSYLFCFYVLIIVFLVISSVVLFCVSVVTTVFNAYKKNYH